MDPAPAFRLGSFELKERDTPVLLAFFKITCPTCQLAFPYLQRLADRGPRAFAGALASLCDVEAARLSVRRLSDADALRLIADQASAARSRATDAIEQAAISLDALADMQLMAAGAQAESLPMATVRGVPDAVAAARSLDDADRALAKSAPDTGAAIEALRRAFEADAATAPSVALGLAQVSSTGPQRRAWLEAAELLGAGASLPDDASSDRRDALGAAQLLAWAARGQGDRLALARLSGPQRQAADRLAAACGVSSEQCMQALRETDDRLHQVTVAALRARVAAALGSGHPSWSSVIDGGQASPLPEADAARPWRLVVP